MNLNNILIDENTIREYVFEYNIIAGLPKLVEQAQEENPGIQALALSTINIERTIDDLKERGITTIEALNTKLVEHKEAINRIFDNYDPAQIAAKHVFTPIYIFLETGYS